MSNLTIKQRGLISIYLDYVNQYNSDIEAFAAATNVTVEQAQKVIDKGRYYHALTITPTLKRFTVGLYRMEPCKIKISLNNLVFYAKTESGMLVRGNVKHATEVSGNLIIIQ